MGYRKAMTSYLIGDTVSGQPVTWLEQTKQTTNSVAWVRERTTRTERLPLVGEDSANFRE
jgi:hypothetical protein